MPNISTTFQCAECKSSLEVTVSYSTYGEEIEFSVNPCEKCLEDAREEGRDEAREEQE